MTFLKVVLIGCVGIYLSAAAAMYIMQRQFQYFPSHNNPLPSSKGLSGVKVEQLVTSDGETLVLWYAIATKGQPTVLFFQGNGGEVSDRADRFAAYQAAGFGVAFISTRGYGGSTGTPSEAGFLIDAQTAYDWLIAEQVAAETIAVVGESLGTGIAVQLAGKTQVGALVLGAPYASAVEIAAGQFPWLPVKFLMLDQFRSIDRIGTVKAPTLILHGTTDQVIPFSSGQRLHQATVAPTTFIPLEGKGHEALYEPETWAQEIAFLLNVFAR